MIKEGIININKPAGMTSHDCIYVLRRVTGIKRIGHTGTLDPNATGVLPICIGSSSRVAEYMDLDYKAYHCTLTLGLETDTLDIWGAVLADKRGTFICTEAQIRDAFAGFSGKISQYPPKYSAVRIGGRRLYEYARSGEEIEIKPREVYIESLDIEDIDLEKNEITFSVTCSKGTYIRTICSDVGTILGCGAAMSALTRTRSGVFTLEDAVPLATLQAGLSEEEINAYILPTDTPLVNFGVAVIKTEERAKWFVNGGHIRFSETEILKRPKFADCDPPMGIREEYRAAYNLYAPLQGGEGKGAFLGVAFYNKEYKKLVADKVFCRR